jgi:uncharacterized protein YbjT (DUF2867 family)
MTTIAIIGGHGQIGLLAARELTEAGHRVLAVIRNVDHSEEVSATGATPVVLDIESASPPELVDAIGPVDSIIFAAGAGTDSGPARKETVDHQGAVTSLSAAESLGARFIVVSYLGADTPATGDESWVAYQRAKKAADDAVRASSVDWTIVRPGSLNNDARSGLVTIDSALTGGTTSRANVAALLALLATSHLAPGRVLNVIDGDVPIADALGS